MTPERRRIPFVGACFVGLITLFPPWCVDAVNYPQPRTYAVGYGFVAGPPVPEARLDWARLAAELVGALVVVAGHVVLWGGIPRTRDLNETRESRVGPITAIRP